MSRQQPVKYGICNASAVFLLPTTATSHGATVSVTILALAPQQPGPEPENLNVNSNLSFWL